MKILIMGGTGAMGKEIVALLAKNRENCVKVTSRQKFDSNENITYLQGNAMEMGFIEPLLKNEKFDVVVDFMLYSVMQFRERYELLLQSCKQYIFFSSARVYAASDMPVMEESPRLLDVTTDMEYLKDEEYSLTKAKEEDILKSSNYQNYVIIRPYKTYNDNRLQLGVFEKEQWFHRAVLGKTVVVPGSIEDLHTSLTSAKDNAKVLHRIIGDMSLNGEVIQIANPERITWGEVIQLYSSCIEKRYGRKLKVFYAKDTSEIEALFNNKYRIKYDGLVDRVFDDSKIKSLMGEEFSWTPVSVGLIECVNHGIEQYEEETSPIKNLRMKNYSIEGLYDKLAGEYISVFAIPGIKNRLKYLIYHTIDAETIRKIKQLISR